MRYIILILILTVGVTGCNSVRTPENYPMTASYFPAEQPSQLSYGMVKRGFIPGRTTQADVLNKFGAPNNMTFQVNGEEMWVYDQVVTETSTDARGEHNQLGLSFFSLNNPVLGLRANAGQYNRAAITRSSLKTLTVLLTFDTRGVLKDVSARRGGY